MTASPYDGPLSVLRNRVDDLGVWLAVWEARNEPDAHARRCASDAVDAIDAALRDLHSVRQELITEIRDGDDASAVRADELLRDTTSAAGGGSQACRFAMTRPCPALSAMLAGSLRSRTAARPDPR